MTDSRSIPCGSCGNPSGEFGTDEDRMRRVVYCPGCTALPNRYTREGMSAGGILQNLPHDVAPIPAPRQPATTQPVDLVADSTVPACQQCGGHRFRFFETITRGYSHTVIDASGYDEGNPEDFVDGVEPLYYEGDYGDVEDREVEVNNVECRDCGHDYLGPWEYA